MSSSVLVIGGGPAGLTGALRLSTHGYAVRLLEQRSELGGRLISSGTGPGDCRTRQGSFPHGPAAYTEHFPTVLLGCHTATLAVLESLGTRHLVEFPQQLRFEFLLPGPRRVRLGRPWVPGPFGAILSAATFRGLPLRDRWRVLNVLERTWEGDPALSLDLESRSGEDWLKDIGQSDTGRAQFWAPLARFLTGDDVAVISASALINMVRRCFLSARQHSALAIPTRGIASLLLEPIHDRIARSGAVIRLETRATQIRFDTNRVIGVVLQDGTVSSADWYLVALPHRQLVALLPDRALTHFSYFQQLTQLTDSSALTLHVRIDCSVPSPQLLLLAHRTYHWIVCRPNQKSEQKGCIISLVAVGRPELLERPDQELLDIALSEVAYAFPGLTTAKVLGSRIIRQPHAYLSMRPGTSLLRPLQQSPYPNLLLAGDWTDTGLPASLEGAVLSGIRCAEAIITTEATENLSRVGRRHARG